MTTPPDSPDQEAGAQDAAPPSPPQNLALLKGLTAFLGMLLLGGFALLAVLLFTRGADEMEDASAAERRITLAPGERVTERTVTPEGAAVVVEGPEGTRIYFFDAGTGGVTVLHLRNQGQ